MRFGGMVLTAVLLVGACSSDPAPKEPAETPKASSAAPTVAAPVMPDQAREDSPEGAAAFVGHYIEVFNHAARTGDVTELSEMSSPDCTGCQRYIKLYRDTYAAGGYFKGGDWKPGEFDLRSGEVESYLTTTVQVPSSLYKEDRSTPEKRDPGEQSRVSFAVQRHNGSWQISQFGQGGIK